MGAWVVPIRDYTLRCLPDESRTTQRPRAQHATDKIELRIRMRCSTFQRLRVALAGLCDRSGTIQRRHCVVRFKEPNFHRFPQNSLYVMGCKPITHRSFPAICCNLRNTWRNTSKLDTLVFSAILILTLLCRQAKNVLCWGYCVPKVRYC
jgi:hypothetical protein